MLKVMSYILQCRRETQQQVLDHVAHSSMLKLISENHLPVMIQKQVIIDCKLPLSSMLKVMSYILLHRQKTQQHVLDHVFLYLMLKLMSKIIENRRTIQQRVIKSKLPCLTLSLSSMLKVMSHILLHRQKTQQQVLDHVQ